MLTNKNLVAFCLRKAAEKTKYMWGDYGRQITLSTIEGKAKQYPQRYSKSRIAELKKCVGTHYGCDCAGLIKWFLWTNNGLTPIKYASKTDRNCSSLLRNAKVSGDIKTLPEIEGLILYKEGHVGVYVGNGKAVECTLGAYGDGVVITNVKGRGWTKWFMLNDIEYIDNRIIKVGDTVTYNGNKHYKSSNGLIPLPCKGGKATVTATKLGAKHPYHLVRDKSDGATVYGWVNKEYIL